MKLSEAVNNREGTEYVWEHKLGYTVSSSATALKKAFAQAINDAARMPTVKSDLVNVLRAIEDLLVGEEEDTIEVDLDSMDYKALSKLAAKHDIKRGKAEEMREALKEVL